MPRFTKYTHTHLLTPERAPLPKVARAQRLTKLLERDPRFADLPNFAAGLKALSPAPNLIDTALSKLDNNKVSKRDPRKALIAAALSGFNENHFSDPAQRAAYRKLRQMQLNSPEPAKRGGQKNVSPTGGDRRRYNPHGKNVAYTKYGNFARYAGSPLASSWMQVFRNPWAVIPCIQRKERTEVMFAKGYAGKGYKVKHRKGPFSGVPC